MLSVETLEVPRASSLRRQRSGSVSSYAGSECSSSSISSPSFSVKEDMSKIKSLQKENFDLKLRIYLLEERIGGRKNLTCKHANNESEAEKQVNWITFWFLQVINYLHFWFKLRECRQSLQNCINLVEEAANQIEHLENKLEQQKVTFEEKLIKAESELSLQKLNQKKESDRITVRVRCKSF